MTTPTTLVGYARVSTTDQDHTTQVDRLTAAGCARIFSEKKSGTTKAGRAALDECLAYLRDGDTLVFTKIDRLARSSRDLQNIVHDLESRGVTIMALDQAIDTRTPHGKAFLGMLAVFAEFETNIRKERQLEGIAKAKTKGVYTGRKPTALLQAPKVRELLATGATAREAAKTLGISVSSVYNITRTAAA